MSRLKVQLVSDSPSSLFREYGFQAQWIATAALSRNTRISTNAAWAGRPDVGQGADQNQLEPTTANDHIGSLGSTVGHRPVRVLHSHSEDMVSHRDLLRASGVQVSLSDVPVQQAEPAGREFLSTGILGYHSLRFTTRRANMDIYKEKSVLAGLTRRKMEIK